MTCSSLLVPVAAEFHLPVVVIDIGTDPALVERYDEDVPVLLLDGVEVCRHRFDEGAWCAAGRWRAGPAGPGA